MDMEQLADPPSSSALSSSSSSTTVDVRVNKSVSTPSFIVDYLSGAVGGVAVVLVGHPFDVRF